MDTQAPAVVVLRTGDRVLIALTEDPPVEDVHEYLVGLAGAFPGVQFVVMGGVAGMAILGGIKEPDET